MPLVSAKGWGYRRETSRLAEGDFAEGDLAEGDLAEGDLARGRLKCVCV